MKRGGEHRVSNEKKRRRQQRIVFVVAAALVACGDKAPTAVPPSPAKALPAPPPQKAALSIPVSPSQPVTAASASSAPPEVAEPSPWKAVSKHGLSAVYPAAGLVASGNRLASVNGHALRWEPCLSNWSDFVHGAWDIHQLDGAGLLAFVSVGIQSSTWVQRPPNAKKWNRLAGSFAEKRTRVLDAAISPAERLLLHRRLEWDGAATASFHRVGRAHKPLSLKVHKSGCVNDAEHLAALAAGPRGAAVLCDLGVEQWTGAKWRNRYAPLPKAMKLTAYETKVLCDGDGAVDRWAGLRQIANGYEVIAPARKDAGTVIGHLNAGKWTSVRRFLDQAVSAYRRDDKGAWLTTVHPLASGTCETQLWRRDGAGNPKPVGAALAGGTSWLLIDAKGFPTLVTKSAMLVKNASGEKTVPSTEPIYGAAMVDGAVWLNRGERGWTSLRTYTEHDTPGGTCP